MNPHDNLFHLHDVLQTAIPKSGFIGPDYSWIRDVGEMVLWPNRSYRFTPSATMSEVSLQLLVQLIDRGLAPLEVQIPNVLCHHATIAWFLQHGFELKRKYPGMSVTAQQWLAPSPPHGISVVKCYKLDDERDYHDWCVLVGNGFWHEPLAEKLYRQFQEYFPDDERFAFFLTRVDGIPAATTMTFTSPESQGIYLVYVDPQFRHRGLGSQIVDAAVRQGFEAGYNTVILQASAEGEPLYRKLGFVADFDYLLLVRSRKE